MYIPRTNHNDLFLNFSGNLLALEVVLMVSYFFSLPDMCFNSKVPTSMRIYLDCDALVYVSGRSRSRSISRSRSPRRPSDSRSRRRSRYNNTFHNLYYLFRSCTSQYELKHDGVTGLTLLHREEEEQTIQHRQGEDKRNVHDHH